MHFLLLILVHNMVTCMTVELIKWLVKMLCYRVNQCKIACVITKGVNVLCLYLVQMSLFVGVLYIHLC